MRKLSIVFQTHWDREWYFSLDTFNVRLMNVMDNIYTLLSEDAIAHFVLDGQVKAIEDYFEMIDSQKREAWLEYIKSGKVIIGPWYVLSDEFLVSGESLIRNLEIGLKRAEALGNVQNIGYLPDTFGHISQMPQILKGFEIEDAIMWRGIDLNHVFFNWEAPNGSKVFTVFLKEGYYQPIVDQPNYQTLLKTFLAKHDKLAESDHVLLTNGGDHLMPAEGDISERLSTLEKTLDLEIEVTSYQKYLEKVKPTIKKLPVLKSELRENTNAYVLPNVLSARYPLKDGNQAIEDVLTMRLEPLIARAYLNKDFSRSVWLENLWTRTLENHPHDSICGCSIDAVHQEMDTRYRKINDSIKAMEEDLLSRLGSQDLIKHKAQSNIFSDDTQFSLYNPTPYAYYGQTTAELFVHEGSPLHQGFNVYANGIKYTTTVVSKKETRRFNSPLEDAPQFRKGTLYTVTFKVDGIEGFAFRNFELIEGPFSDLETKDQPEIENDYYRVTVNNAGQLDVFDKTTQRTYEGLHQLTMSLDAGDEYNYSKPSEDTLSEASLVSVKAFKAKNHETLEISLEIEAPSGLDESREKAALSTVKNIANLTVKLNKTSKLIDCSLQYENNAKNQRTRLVFPQSSHVKTHYSDTAFDLVERTVRKEVFKAEKGKEVPVVVDPSSSTILTDQGFVFYHRGLQEYQVVDQASKSQVEVTLLRSVGHLSRDDLASRGGGAGPSFETPDAQMIGTYTYRYQFGVNATHDACSVAQFRNPLSVHKGHVSRLGSLINIDNNALAISSCRHTNEGLEVRLYNTTKKDQTFTLRSAYEITSIHEVNLKGTLLDENPKYTLPPKTIKTYRIKLKEPKTIAVDALVVGGSIGGVLAARVLAEQNNDVLLIEETQWIGGQLTNQAVPLDEHPFVEKFGTTKTYRTFRNQARAYYHNKYELKNPNDSLFDPGNSWVTRLAFEPKVAHQMFEEMTHSLKTLTVKTSYKAVSSSADQSKVHHVIIKDLMTGKETQVKAKFFLDGTDHGDLLPLTKTPYNLGAEAKSDTQEPHAKDKADSLDMQPVTHVAALKWVEGNQDLIKKPKTYEMFNAMMTPYDVYPILSMYGPDSTTKKAKKFNIKEGRMPLWSYRRFYDPNQYKNPDLPEMTLLNWPQNDYFMGNLIDNEDHLEHRALAKELTNCFIYYLQNEVENEDGTKGYKEMCVAKEVLGNKDGLAMAPYVRESRRIKALETIKEQDVSAKTNDTLPTVKDSVGVGSYHVDLHITTRSHTFFYDNTWPFEIPLKALIPIKKTNLLPACKNIGTTHLTNGCFRLHPVEWNIGEAVGYLTDYLIKENLTPQAFVEDEKHVKAYLKKLEDAGIERHWPKDQVHVI